MQVVPLAVLLASGRFSKWNKAEFALLSGETPNFRHLLKQYK